LSNTQLVGVDGSILIFNQIKTELREREWGWTAIWSGLVPV
jgi:preprotein translocase subunit SecD